MKFTPDYAVMYRGVRHRTGETFDIMPEDAEEMKRHGRVEDEPPKDETNARRPGRPKKG